MKVTKEEILETELERRTSEGKLKSLVVFFLVCAIGVGGFFIYKLYQENNQLTSVIEERQNNLQHNSEIFEKIEKNLAEIRTREGIVTNYLEEDENHDTPLAEERIFNEIAAIEELNRNNKELIDQLNKTIYEQGNQIITYKKTTAGLRTRLKEYKTRTEILLAESSDLRNNLDSANSKNRSMQIALNYKKNEVEDINLQLENQLKKLEEKNEVLNTAYYRVGSFKELRNEHVIYKEGGIAGIASVVSVRPDVEENQFKKVNISNLNMIPINSQEAEVISNHEINTYEIIKDANGNIRWLKINDKNKFWDKTKYLVVVTKNEIEEEVAVN